MKITEFQALNIVRTYNKQLRIGALAKGDAPDRSDTVSLSAEARKIGNGAASEPSFNKVLSDSLSSVETRIKSNSDLHIQRNLPFE